MGRLLANPPVSAPTAPTAGRVPKQRQVRLTEAQAAELVAEYLAGASITGMATKYHVNHATALRRLRRAGVPTRSQARAILDGELSEVQELRAQGWSYQQIGQRYRCCRRTVQNTLRRIDSSTEERSASSSQVRPES